MKRLRFLPILLFLATSLQAQELPKNQQWITDDFSGGLNLKLSEYNLPSNRSTSGGEYATIAENIRFGTKLKSATKRDEVFSYGSADTTEAITGMHRLYLKDGTKRLLVTHGDELEVGDDSLGTFTNLLTFTTGNYRWQWVTWHDVAIGSDGYNQPIKTNGTVATYLGSCGAVDR
ncbi:unnamed protein product, partial [marine sediment metagenome]